MPSTGLRRGLLCAVLGSCWAASAAIAPSAVAEPGPIPAPNGPMLGQSCDDLDKLADDTSAGQIVCTHSGWQRSVTPVGVHVIGTPCTPSVTNSQMASSTDGHLIWCAPDRAVWALYTP